MIVEFAMSAEFRNEFNIFKKYENSDVTSYLEKKSKHLIKKLLKVKKIIQTTSHSNSLNNIGNLTESGELPLLSKMSSIG
jgi:hypothetical protein